MKRIMIFLFSLLFLLSGSAYAMTLAWDTYTDDKATGLRIYHSIDQTNWNVLVDNIPTTSVASEIPDNPNDNERVYYVIRAFDPTEESGNSNIVSFFWTIGGGGSTKPASVGGLKLLDCDPYDAKLDDGSDEWDVCNERYK